MKQEPCNYLVFLLDFTGSKTGYDHKEKLLVARFFALGDAVAYAIHRGNTTPEGFTHVFEVETHKGHRIYRAG